MVSLEWPSTTLLVEETKSGSKQFLSLRNVSHSGVGKWERENSVERSCKQLMDPCAVDSLLTSRAWTLCPSGN